MLSYSQDLTINYTLNFNCRINAAISVCTLIYCRIYTQNNVKLLGVNEHLRKMIEGLVESLQTAADPKIISSNKYTSVEVILVCHHFAKSLEENPNS